MRPLWTPALMMLGAYGLLFLFAMCLLFAQRYRQPIKARSPALLAVSSLGGLIVASWMMLMEAGVVNPGSQFNCALGAWAMNVGHPLLFLPYMLRCYRLHMIFSLTIEKQTATEKVIAPTASASALRDLVRMTQSYAWPCATSEFLTMS